MNLEDIIAKSMNQSAVDVFSTMLGVELAAGAVTVESGTPEANDGVMSFIGLAGAWSGSGSLTCSPALACRICAQMLMMEVASVNEDVLDAVAELTNMIIGSVKNDLEAHLGPLGLSIPTVVFGRNFKTKSARTSEWIVLRFPWDHEVLVVKLCLAPSEKTAHAVTHMLGQTCPLEV